MRHSQNPGVAFEEYLNVPSHEVILYNAGCCKVQHIGNYEPGIVDSGSTLFLTSDSLTATIVCEFQYHRPYIEADRGIVPVLVMAKVLRQFIGS